MNKLIDNPQYLDAISIGKRIKSARMLSGHSRKTFSLGTKISAATLRLWEDPSIGRSGLTENGAERLVTAFHQCGISCTMEWLLSGKGVGPKLINSSSTSLNEDFDLTEWSEEGAILKDIEAFKQNNPNPIVAIISDDGMAPIYQYGEYVAGNKKFGDDIKTLIGLDCIIETKSRIMVRRIIEPHTFLAVNQNFKKYESIVIDNEVLSAAEIVFHRWRTKRLSSSM